MESLKYQPGFGNEFTTEALPGALPQGQNSPQRAPLGLYAEKFNGTTFTAPRDARSVPLQRRWRTAGRTTEGLLAIATELGMPLVWGE